MIRDLIAHTYYPDRTRFAMGFYDGQNVHSVFEFSDSPNGLGRSRFLRYFDDVVFNGGNVCRVQNGVFHNCNEGIAHVVNLFANTPQTAGDRDYFRYLVNFANCDCDVLSTLFFIFFIFIFVCFYERHKFIKIKIKIK